MFGINRLGLLLTGSLVVVLLTSCGFADHCPSGYSLWEQNHGKHTDYACFKDGTGIDPGKFQVNGSQP